MSTDGERGAEQSEGRRSPEEREREAARRRGEERERKRAAGEARNRGTYTGQASPDVAARAFAALAENTRDYAIFLLDADGVITFWGEGARLIKWWTKAEAEGAHLRLLYPVGGSNDGTAEEHLRQAAERGEYTGEGQRIRSDGSTFWAGVTLTALWDEDGTLLGFGKTTRDLTARRAADALLQSAAEAAESARAEAVSASAAKSGFLATMSHEIRTPINAILGYHEMLDLEMDGPLSAGQRRHLARAGASARHLRELVTEVLDFSRIEADHVSVGHAAFRVGDAVGGAIEMVAPQARGRGLELADAVSGYAAGLAAWGDEGRVRQILINIIANAIKFTTPRESEAGRITLSAGTATRPSPDVRVSGEGPWVYVRVEDTGVGIPPDRLQPIFEPFVQGDMSLTRSYGGTGLGLAISRRLARLMGGDVTVRSEVGVGSTFFLWLPAAPVASLQTGGVEGHGPGGEAPGPIAGAANVGHVDGAAVGAGSADAGTRAKAGDGAPSGGRHSGPFGGVAEALLGDLERVLHAYVARLRSDPATPSAHEASEAQVEDHLASFLADLAGTLHQLDAASGVAGESTPELRDGTAIQRVVAERHGAQRARLGWTEGEMRREFTILREEVSAAVQRRAPQLVRGPDAEARSGEAGRALELMGQLIAFAERLSMASHREATTTTTRPATPQGAVS